VDSDKSPVGRPIEWVFRTSLLLLGATIALNLAIVYVQPVLPWLIGGVVLTGTSWLVIVIVRWRRSRW
jgi:hypothetical protein